MNDYDPFEAELQRLKPAEPPAGFAARVAAALPAEPARHESSSSPLTRLGIWWRQLRWLIPTAATAAVLVLLLLRHSEAPATAAVMRADKVEIDQHLVTAFDAVGQLPSGEPVRFRCRQFMDNVVLRDSAKGVVIEQRIPRLVVVPVSFDTY